MIVLLPNGIDCTCWTCAASREVIAFEDALRAWRAAIERRHGPYQPGLVQRHHGAVDALESELLSDA